MSPRRLAAAILALVLSAPARAADPAPRGRPTILHEMSGAIARIVSQVSPAVVQIRVSGYGLARDVTGEGGVLQRQHAVGSGVIVDPDGYILTNDHVVRGAQRIQVVIPADPSGDGGKGRGGRHRIYDAKVIAAQANIDLALLRIEAKGLPTLPLDGAATVRQGELVLAVGSPQGLASTVTMGVVSSSARELETGSPLAIPMLLIQTDAPINPGNSGGPLVNADGVLVGINTFILSQSGGSQGLGFAIPVPMVKLAYDSLRKYGRVRRIEAGVVAVSVTPALAAGLGLARDWGALVADVAPGGAASAAGLQAGDVIESFDGRPIDSLPALTGALFLHDVTRPVEMKVLRGSETLALTIHAPEAPEPASLLADLGSPEKGLVPRLGIVGVDLGDRLREILPPLRIPSGVVVTARTVGPVATESGLQPGDVIHSVNRTPVDSLETLRRVVGELRPGEAAVLQVERQGRLNFLALELD